MTLDDLVDHGWITVLDEDGQMSSILKGYEERDLYPGSYGHSWVIKDVQFEYFPQLPTFYFMERTGESCGLRHFQPVMGEKNPEPGSGDCVHYTTHGLSIYIDTPGRCALRSLFNDSEADVGVDHLRFQVTDDSGGNDNRVRSAEIFRTDEDD